MSTPRTPEPTTGKTIALAATIFASAVAIVALASFDPVSDTEIPVFSFDVAPPVASAPADAPKEPSSTLLTAAGGRARPASEPWSPDESAGGTRPDAMH